jgi:hypothetical protein
LYSIAENARKSGRADGNVYMRNHRIRGMAMPSNPQTAPQTVQRGNFGSLSGNWNNLSEDDRASWNEMDVAVIDRMGHSITLSGKDLYVRLNRNLFNAGQTALTTAPIPSSPLGISSISVVADESLNAINLTWTPTPIPADTTWLVFATGNQSVGTYRPGESLYKLITVLPTATATGEDVSGAWISVFGAITAGNKIFFKLIAIKNTTGFASPPTVASTIIIA